MALKSLLRSKTCNKPLFKPFLTQSCTVLCFHPLLTYPSAPILFQPLISTPIHFHSLPATSTFLPTSPINSNEFLLTLTNSPTSLASTQSHSPHQLSPAQTHSIRPSSLECISFLFHSLQTSLIKNHLLPLLLVSTNSQHKTPVFQSS